MRAALAGPLSQKRPEVPYIGGHEYTAFGGGKVQDLRVGEPFELYLGVQGSHIVSIFGESFAHRPARDVGI